MTSARPRVAVVGAGPSGLYAAAALVASDAAVGVAPADYRRTFRAAPAPAVATA